MATSPVRLLLAVVIGFALSGLRAENVDPQNDGSQYVWGENVGWINLEPQGDGGPGVEVTDDGLHGFMWGENVGYISLSCDTTSSCATVDFGVTNDGFGALAGYAWGENIGFVSFSCENTASCATAEYRVQIDPDTGRFQGFAWAENVGFIRFDKDEPDGFSVETAWSCTPPTEAPWLSVDRSGSFTLLSWNQLAQRADGVGGDLDLLRGSGGNYAAATLGCLFDDSASTSHLVDGDPPGSNFWYLVRVADCNGGSFDSGGSGQVASRDAGIAGSGDACP